MTSNMKLWEAVATTNPKYTKKVNQRGGFTAINAQYQIMRATEAFGPVGAGWGYDIEHSVLRLGDGPLVMAVCDVTVWHGRREQRFGPFRTMNPLMDEKGRPDDDAAKKAATDGITKALSHLGFSADVFLGQFDDNKYLNTLANKFGSEDAPITPEGPKVNGARTRAETKPSNQDEF
jgi:hypothetical protein